jgi:hypothetical protein
MASPLGSLGLTAAICVEFNETPTRAGSPWPGSAPTARIVLVNVAAPDLPSTTATLERLAPALAEV